MNIFGRARRNFPSGNTPFRPRLEQLEDRLVPATVLDIAALGAVASVSSDSHPELGPVALFRQADAQPTGTGVIESFLRMEAKGPKATIEQGYNTDARPLQFDEKAGANFTRAIRLDDIPVVTIGGVRYREFLLDVNQPGSSSKISLDQLRLFVGDVPNLTGYSTTSNTLAGRTAVFDLDAVNPGETGDTRWVKIDARLNSGSGSGDVYVDIADRLFAGAGGNPYVYLFSRFGDNIAARAGFEEWAVVRSPVAAPSVSTLSGNVSDINGSPVQGILVTLTGLTEEGQEVNRATTTDAVGNYQFNDLSAGSYTVQAMPQFPLIPVSANPGTIGGTPDGEAVDAGTITSIDLGSELGGINFNFVIGFAE